jgi:hypothetical protein
VQLITKLTIEEASEPVPSMYHPDDPSSLTFSLVFPSQFSYGLLTEYFPRRSLKRMNRRRIRRRRRRIRLQGNMYSYCLLVFVSPPYLFRKPLCHMKWHPLTTLDWYVYIRHKESSVMSYFKKRKIRAFELKNK